AVSLSPRTWHVSSLCCSTMNGRATSPAPTSPLTAASGCIAGRSIPSPRPLQGLSRAKHRIDRWLWWPHRRAELRSWARRGAAMMVVGGLLLWLVLAPAYNSCSANGTVACGLGENVAATFVVAALAWLLWYFWTRTRLVHNYVALVRSRPEDLLGTASSGVRAAA